MRTITSYISLLFVSLLFMCISSCGNDDGGELIKQDPYAEADFVGAWKCIDDMEVQYFVLNFGGTGRLVMEDLVSNNVEAESINWYYKDQNLILLSSTGKETMFVSKLLDKLMILVSEEGETYSYTRISQSEIPSGNPDNPDKPEDPDNPDYPDTPDTPDTPDIPAGSGITTGSAEPRAFRAKLSGIYAGYKLPEIIGFQYSYDSSFPSKQVGEVTMKGKFGGFELDVTGLVDQVKVYYRAYAVVDGINVYGETKSFETLPGTYSIDGKTYKFIKVTGLATGSFSMMQTELPPSAEVEIDGISIGCLDTSTYEPVTKGETREFFNEFAAAAVIPRYPTPQEWLYAAAGGSKSQGYKYSGSNDIDEVAWYSENSNGHVRKPAQKKPNELGFYDMSGNYAELCSTYDEEMLEDFIEKYIKGFVPTVRDMPLIYFNVGWMAGGGAFGGDWSSSASKCQASSSVAEDSPSNTNKYNGNIFTIRLVYSRPD